ncbi:ArsR family transcriptional regulator [Pseudophaeobacter leonis]|uniref:arsenate reductase/protein-tyrosine-phosphatase family protein n=1 Tax=Pseudophaeobacter leonis TaxID=1144477 RepID=UPI003B986D96
MRRFPAKVAAGDISAALSHKPNTTSAYLSNLRQAGLISQSRQGNSLLYCADLDGLRGMFDMLLTGCCQNRPDICMPGPVARLAQPTSERPLKVLFICTGNAARSIMAESLLNRLGEGRFQAYSAGTHPGTGPNTGPSPRVLSLLAEKGYDTSSLSSKTLATFSGPDAEKMDFIFTVCDHAANEECPAWPGQPMSAHWGMPDPLQVTGSEAVRSLALQQSYGLLKRRITAFAALPFDTLDRISLQHQSDAIGTLTSET